MRGFVALTLLVFAPCALGQESPSYVLEEQILNNAGHPCDTIVMSSTSYKVSLDSVGETLGGRLMQSATYRMDGGFVSAFPPPTEVESLRLLGDGETLVWDPEKSVGVYNLYRDRLSWISALDYGACEQQNLPDETTADPDVPLLGDGFYYLVTAENRLSEEGPKGVDSAGAPRPNRDPCP